jgi:hypothetical protein
MLLRLPLQATFRTKICVKNRYFKNLLLTAGFYLLAISTAFALEKIAPGGPCTPGLGVLGIFILFPLSLILLVRNVKEMTKDPFRLASAAVHLTVFIGLLILIR